jgi:hypothetical protein
MKKSVLLAAAFVAASAASAQTGEITSNRGENWLSQDGDWGLIFDAQPILNYVGNLFNGTSGNGGVALNGMSPSLFNGLPNHSGGTNVIIGGKKLIDANTAYRGKLRIGFGSTKTTDVVDDANPDAADDATVEDVMKNSYMNIVLGAGLEKRVGSTRVVGVYGGELLVGFGNNKTTHEYGNPTGENTTGPRDTEVKHPSSFGLGLQAFAGVEWFFAPKMSLSGEYTWGLALVSTGFTETTSEEYDLIDEEIETTTTTTGPKTNHFSLDTGVSGASIGLNFYFQ